jgi:hypothetical protein
MRKRKKFNPKALHVGSFQHPWALLILKHETKVTMSLNMWTRSLSWIIRYCKKFHTVFGANLKHVRFTWLYWKDLTFISLNISFWNARLHKSISWGSCFLLGKALRQGRVWPACGHHLGCCLPLNKCRFWGAGRGGFLHLLLKSGKDLTATAPVDGSSLLFSRRDIHG